MKYMRKINHRALNLIILLSLNCYPRYYAQNKINLRDNICKDRIIIYDLKLDFILKASAIRTRT